MPTQRPLRFTIKQIKKYMEEQFSLLQAIENISEDTILEANEPKEEVELEINNEEN